MEDDFDSVVVVVEELNSSNLVEDGIVGVVRHVVRRDRWERVALEGKYTAFE